MRLAIIALLVSVASAQSTVLTGTTALTKTTKLGITVPTVSLDSQCIGQSGASSLSSISCSSNLTVSAGDAIACAAGGGGGAGVLSVSDTTNGKYPWALDLFPTAAPGNPQVITLLCGATAGSYAPTLTVNAAATGIGLQCAAFKNVAPSACLDPASGTINQIQNVSSATTNPNAGTAQTPTNLGEVMFGAVGTNNLTPTAGTNYTLLTSPGSCSFPTSNCQYNEYWVQPGMQATNCPFTESADEWTAGCMGLVTAGTTGVTPFTGTFTGFECGGCTNTTAPTAALMANASHGFGAEDSSLWTCTNANTDITFASAAQLSNLITTQYVNGSSYNGSGSVGFQYLTGHTGDGCSFTFPYSLPSVAVGFWMEWDIPNNDSATHDYSMITLENGGGNDYLVAQLNPTGTTMNLRPECKSGVGSNFTASASTLYWVTMDYNTNSGTDSLKIYSSTGSLLSTSTCAAESGSNNATVLIIGNTGAETQASGDHIWFDDFLLSTFVTYPVGP